MKIIKRAAVASAAGAIALIGLAGVTQQAHAETFSCNVTTNVSCPASGDYANPGEAAGTNSGGVIVNQEEFLPNPGDFVSQHLGANSGSDWQVTADIDGTNKAVESYPDTQEVVTNSSGEPTPLADYTTLTSSFTDVVPASPGSSDDWEAAYDLWLGDDTGNTGTDSGKQEIMVWNDNHGQTPGGHDTGNTYTDASTGEVYEIWGFGSVNNPVSLVAKTPFTSGSVDLLTMIKALKTGGYIDSTGLNQVNYGFELCNTSATAESFGVSAYAIAATGDGTNGAPGGGSSPPAGSAPTATTGTASPVGTTTATLNGTVNPGSLATTYQFNYGPTTAYGTSVPATAASAGSGSSGVAESASITGLSPSTTYHDDITATNADGTVTSSDGTFTTAASGPTEAPATELAAPTVSGGDTVDLSWPVPSGDTLAADHWSYFEIDEVKGGVVEHDGDVYTNSASMYLDPGAARQYRVRACNAVGCSAYSPWTYYTN